MATSAFTVANAIARVDQKVRAHAASISELDKIEAIDDANQALWRAMVLAYRAWFVTDAELAIAVDDLDYNLPADFHQIYFLEVTTATKADYRFTPSPMDAKNFRDKRQDIVTALSTDRTFYFDVVGDNPSRFVLAKSIPADESGGLTLKVWYVKELDKLTALSDTLDPGVIPFLGPMCALAAANLVRTRNSELANNLMGEWNDGRAEVVMLAQRAINEPLVTPHLDPATGRPIPAGQQGAL